ncbi:MAG: hypothetical protein AAGB51_03725 [Planctomycetota bacterium]
MSRRCWTFPIGKEADLIDVRLPTPDGVGGRIRVEISLPPDEPLVVVLESRGEADAGYSIVEGSHHAILGEGLSVRINLPRGGRRRDIGVAIVYAPPSSVLAHPVVDCWTPHELAAAPGVNSTERSQPARSATPADEYAQRLDSARTSRAKAFLFELDRLASPRLLAHCTDLDETERVRHLDATERLSRKLYSRLIARQAGSAIPSAEPDDVHLILGTFERAVSKLPGGWYEAANVLTNFASGRYREPTGSAGSTAFDIDGVFVFMFAELAMCCIELQIDQERWRGLLPTFVLMQDVALARGQDSDLPSLTDLLVNRPPQPGEPKYLEYRQRVRAAEARADKRLTLDDVHRGFVENLNRHGVLRGR